MLLVRLSKEPRPQAALTEVFHAAQKTDFYRHWLRSLDAEPEHTLDLLPHVDIAHVDENPEQFRNPRRSGRMAAAFSYPIQPVPRVVVLADGFRRGTNVRVMPKFDINAARDWKADAVAAPLAVLRRLAQSGCTFEFPVVAFTGVRYGYMSAADRDHFWRTFGVPVFEQLTGLDNDVLAEECEAHEGLHIRLQDAIFEFRGKELVVSSLSNFVHPVLRLAIGLTGRLEQSMCSCGKPGPRLMDLQPYRRAKHSHNAAFMSLR